MRKIIFLLTALPPLLASPALGQDLLGPIRDFVDTVTQSPAPPAPRPSQQTAPVAPPPVPRPRPPDLPDAPAVAAPIAPDAEEPAEPEAEGGPQPQPEPDRVYQVACPALIMGLVAGEPAPPLRDGLCGEQSPLLVTGVLSRGRMVALSSPITVNCQMASALPRWVEMVDGYAEAMLDSPLATIETGTSYMCRARNGGDEGLTSEHGFANALDVTGFTLESGESIAVEGDWLPAAEPAGRLLRLAHDAACAGFTTTLGPEANAAHEDHLHLDLGCHGQSCTARICE